jgi:hypothetical protein
MTVRLVKSQSCKGVERGWTRFRTMSRLNHQVKWKESDLAVGERIANLACIRLNDLESLGKSSTRFRSRSSVLVKTFGILFGPRGEIKTKQRKGCDVQCCVVIIVVRVLLFQQFDSYFWKVHYNMEVFGTNWSHEGLRCWFYSGSVNLFRPTEKTNQQERPTNATSPQIRNGLNPFTFFSIYSLNYKLITRLVAKLFW